MAARQQIDAEKRRLEAVKNELADRRRELDDMKIGDELPRGTIEGTVEVALGDNLFEKLASQQIIVKDGVVTEIRCLPMRPEDVILPQQHILQSGQ
jgi:hypothetical protein